MKTQMQSRILGTLATMVMGASAYAVICYGGYQQLTSSGPGGSFVTNCQDLGAPPSGSYDGNWSCFYIFCNTEVGCTVGSNKEATKRFRRVWINDDVAPYVFTQGSPTNVQYGCCNCNPAYSQTQSPPE